MHADQPIHQDSPDIFVDFGLSFHIEAIGFGSVLLSLHVALDVGAVLTNVVDVGKRSFVNLVDVRDDVALYSLIVHGEFCLQADLGQFVPRSEA